jgi:eukaryotic-like serine/threonine-protein kinase
MTRPAELPPTVPSRSPPVAAGESPAGDAAEDVRARLQNALGGAYTIEREIAGGGSSRVFAGMETALERHVAIKVLPPDLIAAINVERFHRETHLVANLQHPHIVPLLTAGTADGMLYYTMPLIDGESLRERIAREGVLAIPEVIRILLEIADALAYASSHGVVHRDVKPGNVLLSAGHALVTDFGIAKAVTSAAAAVKLTSAGIALGTPTYMAPEQGTADASTDHRADIYTSTRLARSATRCSQAGHPSPAPSGRSSWRTPPSLPSR